MWQVMMQLQRLRYNLIHIYIFFPASKKKHKKKIFRPEIHNQQIFKIIFLDTILIFLKFKKINYHYLVVLTKRVTEKVKK